MMSQKSNTTGENAFRVIRGRVGSVSLYEITDSELDLLEKGSPSSLFLNFAIFLFSVGMSFLITILSAPIADIKIYVTFLLFTIIGLLGGAFLFIMWWRMKGEVSDVIKKIKDRIADNDENQDQGTKIIADSEHGENS